MAVNIPAYAITCKKCGKKAHRTIGDPIGLCSDCKKAARKTRKTNHLKELQEQVLEERIARLESIMYDLQAQTKQNTIDYY